MLSTVHETRLGAIVLDAGPEGLTRVAFVDVGGTPGSSGTPVNPADLVDPADPANPADRPHSVLASAIEQLDEYLNEERACFDLPAARVGTPFQRAVWRQLSAIRFGSTVTYGEVARAIGRRDRVRAVAAAIAANPLLLVVPCHRVVAADGSLSGYASGLARKRRLLELEAGVRQGVLL
jgi:methylated-DNA-[protein]-cysteine S-methyltransferase